jgi:hypothetical protein
MNTIQRIAKNTGVLLASQVVSYVFGFLRKFDQSAAQQTLRKFDQIAAQQTIEEMITWFQKN